MTLLWIAIAGAVGCCARYITQNMAVAWLGTSLPYGTLVVNAAGSLLMGFLMVLSLDTQLIPDELRVALSVGFLGGFTTYSTFNLDTLEYFQSGAISKGLTYFALMTLVCMLSGAAGIALAKMLLSLRS